MTKTQGWLLVAGVFIIAALLINISQNHDSKSNSPTPETQSGCEKTCFDANFNQSGGWAYHNPTALNACLQGCTQN